MAMIDLHHWSGHEGSPGFEGYFTHVFTEEAVRLSKNTLEPRERLK
jgi:hypothetical protein